MTENLYFLNHSSIKLIYRLFPTRPTNYIRLGRVSKCEQMLFYIHNIYSQSGVLSTRNNTMVRQPITCKYGRSHVSCHSREEYTYTTVHLYNAHSAVLKRFIGLVLWLVLKHLLSIRRIKTIRARSISFRFRSYPMLVLCAAAGFYVNSQFMCFVVSFCYRVSCNSQCTQ